MMWPVLLVALIMSAGCAGTSTLQVIQAAHRAEVQQSQRLAAELREEVQALQRELGVARTAQARLEGELREAQRQLAEAKHVVDLQREELTRAKEERDRAATAHHELQEQVVELGQLRQPSVQEQTRLQSLEAVVEQHTKELADLKATMRKPATRAKPKPSGSELAPAVLQKESLNRVILTGGSSSGSFPRVVTVQPGDTLWDLARKYRVDLAHLTALNNLTTHLIFPGQDLVLPESPGGSEDPASPGRARGSGASEAAPAAARVPAAD